MGHWKKNQERDIKVPRNKWKWNHSLPAPLRQKTDNSKKKVYSYEW